MSEDFIKEFKDKVYWLNISRYQKLSEDFIREFKDKVDWEFISKYQKLFEDFIFEFQDKLDIDILVERGLITEYRLKKLEYRLKKLKELEMISSRFDILDI